jgi:carbon-monoxide dehydrogenase medium subunit
MFIRRLPEFEHHAPTTVPEVLEILSKCDGRGKVYAGGTDVLVSMKKREIVPDYLICLKGIKELNDIHYDEREGLRIGASVVLGAIERSSIVRDKFRALWDAVKVMAAPQVRNLGTIGGNLCGAVPSADTAPPLIALGASVRLAGKESGRTVLVEDFFKGPRETVMNTNEILTEIVIPSPKKNSGAAYFKLMRRNAMDLALVGVAAHLRLDSGARLCQEARVALGAVGPIPARARKAEEVLMDREIEEDLAHEAGTIASQEARPITDVRASEAYRRAMVSVLTKRAVMAALARTKCLSH